MKTLKYLLIAALSIFVMSCSNDDDGSSSSEPLYFPRVITTTYPVESTKTVTLDYDQNNRIIQFVITQGSNTDIFDISYGASGLINTIELTEGTSVTTHSFEYANDHVSGVTISYDGVPSDVYDITYDAPSNTYSVLDGSNNILFEHDSSGNIEEIGTDFGNINFNYNSNNGVFKGIADNFPLFATVLLSSNNNIYSTLLFASKEITSISVIGNGVNINTSRNAQNEIESMEFVETSSSSVQFTSTITYQLR